MKVRETYLSIPVTDMERARRFYVRAFDASVQYESPGWSSLRIAGVRLGLNASPHDAGSRTGLHFVVDDLALACEAIASAGGEVVAHPSEVQSGVVLADVAATEDNIFTPPATSTRRATSAAVGAIRRGWVPALGDAVTERDPGPLVRLRADTALTRSAW
jgi:predicted enzyme related to lactoylglutathione lyase